MPRGFKITFEPRVRKVAPKSEPAIKATAAEIDRENRERWKAEILTKLTAETLLAAEARRATLADAAEWVLSTPAGAKPAQDYADLGGAELTPQKLARRAADYLTAEGLTATKSADGARLEKTLRDLESLSRAAAKAAETIGWSAMYGRHERAAAAIRAGEPFEKAVAMLRG